MPHSLRAKLSGLRYKGILEDKDYKRLCHALDLEKAEQDIPTMIYPQVEGITPTVVKVEQEPCEDDYQTDMDEAWKQAKQEEYEKAYDDYLALVNAEQEPCDDVVSRQALLEYLESNSDDFPEFHEAIEKVLDMPPVQPKRQTGKWIKIYLTDTGDIDGQCSECRFIHRFVGGHTAQYNFCPNCGADMRGDNNE